MPRLHAHPHAAPVPLELAMTRPTVVNKRKHTPTKDDVYIGRPSKWGNPFTDKPVSATLAHWQCASRDEAIARYREWITMQPELMKSLPYLAGKNLVCWCKPEPCHGDVLADLVAGIPDNTVRR
jgi:hypothetical protein